MVAQLVEHLPRAAMVAQLVEHLPRAAMVAQLVEHLPLSCHGSSVGRASASELPW